MNIIQQEELGLEKQGDLVIDEEGAVAEEQEEEISGQVNY